MKHRLCTRLLALTLLVGLPALAHATERRFAFTYETTTAAKGSLELENWVTWDHFVLPGKDSDGLTFRHEFEYGVTDRFLLGFYVANWTYDNFSHGARYESSSLEAIYNLTNPNTSWLGSALYLEVGGGEHVFSLEGKLLLQKNIGPVIVAYNASLEATWEGDDFGHLNETEGEFAQTLGVSYEVSKHFAFGAEAVHELAFPDWRDTADHVVWVGPNLSFRYGRAYATVSGLFQCTDNKTEPDVTTRLIFGIQF